MAAVLWGEASAAQPFSCRLDCRRHGRLGVGVAVLAWGKEQQRRRRRRRPMGEEASRRCRRRRQTGAALGA